MAQTRRSARRVSVPHRKRLATREGAIVTTIALPAVLHRQATLAAIDRRWSLMEVMREALREWLEREARGRRGGGRAR